MSVWNIGSNCRPALSKWIAVAASVAAAILWALLAAYSFGALLVSLPSVLVSVALCVAFAALAVAVARGSCLALLQVTTLSLIATVLLLYAPALAMGGPVSEAPASVVCATGPAICWNHLHHAFIAQVSLFSLSVFVAINALCANRGSGA
jgi:hypothetical protein